ncbi:MAG: bifunctional fucokinase/L-fucose-1-P-guanylyltransferase [Prevotellaceae bacterium]|nr:bifunctional fucokinase/L-fucose-1-P-guanylyltransferase [Prevotellaceae bacterium]
MKKLLTLPPCLVNTTVGYPTHGYSSEAPPGLFEASYACTPTFCACDPIDRKVGSGGGTAWLLKSCHEAEGEGESFEGWLAKEKRILLHAGGQSRRLPSYAPSGKVLTPIPIFRWAKGQRLSQNLLELQLPLYESIMELAPEGLHTLIASGDVFVRAGKLQEIPFADVVCFGLWANPELASRHGVFVSDFSAPERLEYMLQKPTVEELGRLMPEHLLMMDVGIWLLSDRAVDVLMRKSLRGGEIAYYDLYGEFGCSLGDSPKRVDEEVSSLSVAVVPLPEGEFYHYGTNEEMISSTVAIQNLVLDQRSIYHLGVKPHPSIFIQNSVSELRLTHDNQNIWIENSHIGKGWTLSRNNIVTGVPRNEWRLSLQPSACVDVVPWEEHSYVLRPYGFFDEFRGRLGDASTTFLGKPASQWLESHGIRQEDVQGSEDIQMSKLFPVCNASVSEMGSLFQWMLADNPSADDEGARLYKEAEKVSADDICLHANIGRLESQRLAFRKQNLIALALNHRHSVFYQTNLKDMAREFVEAGIPLPQELAEGEPLLKRIGDQMFRSQYLRLLGNARANERRAACRLFRAQPSLAEGQDGSREEAQAFSLLRQGLITYTTPKGLNKDSRGLSEAVPSVHPHRDVYCDQIVWSRSPLRIDIAGGWTDTPPYCLSNGGNVVNLAVELNGQQPLQAYVKCCQEPKIILRSIDLGAAETVTTYEELQDFARVGSPFSIPKAALALAGFSPAFSEAHYKTLEEQLRDFGCGIELTLLSAVPAGSGMGTSSILASTVLGALSDFCGLGWDKTHVCNRTLALEQLLTTGGGWQDQYGGVLHGLKLLRTGAGFDQTPVVNWLPDTLYTDPEYAPCHLLYYTGITRTAKRILAEIVRNMFLSDTSTLRLLHQMKEHALETQAAIMRGDFHALASLVGKTWEQNKQLDPGTNPPEVEAIIRRVSDLCLGLKLPGAGGGGYLYMIAKDANAAAIIRKTLTSEPPNPRARFVEMSLSRTGMQTSRS